MLFSQNTLFSFWPTEKQTQVEKIESTARFIIYGSILAFALKRNVKILVLATVLLIGLYTYSYSIKKPILVSQNTEDPFGNFSYNKVYNKSDASRWATDAFTSDVRNAERNFFTAPSNDMDSFIDLVHGGKNQPFCRQDQATCIADNNPMFMTDPQRQATFNIF